jgi:capsular polysaccharide biosynthesis protein
MGRLAPAQPPPVGDPGTELTEIARRIFRRHWRLIALCVALSVTAVLLYGLVGHRSSYTASARLVLDTADPKSRTESGVIGDTAKAIATSQQQVRAALEQAGIHDRSAADIAKNHVAIRTLGTSAVLQLSVSDRNRHIAMAVANALAQQVIDARLAVSTQLQQTLDDLQQRIDDLNSKIAALDVQADSLTVRLAQAGSTGQASALRSQHDQVLQSRDQLLQERGLAESERLSLITAEGSRPKPSIISRATLPAHADASHLVSYLALGLLLGLIIGVGSAGMIELIRPTLDGGDAIADELGVSFLGALPDEPLARAPRALHALRVRLRLAAEAADVETIALVPVVEHVDLEPLTELLGGDPMARVSVRRLEPADPPRRPGERLGLLAVGPSEIRKGEISDFAQFLTLTPQPVLGLITYDLGSANAPHTAEPTAPKDGEPKAGRVTFAQPVVRFVRRALSTR